MRSMRECCRSSSWVIGAAARDADDCIIFDSHTGALSYDSDGNGATPAIQFAALTPGLIITHQDFLVVYPL
jgi:hypothetical protein